eukprot:6471469-Amphidinium_carterae.2
MSTKSVTKRVSRSLHLRSVSTHKDRVQDEAYTAGFAALRHDAAKGKGAGGCGVLEAGSQLPQEASVCEEHVAWECKCLKRALNFLHRVTLSPMLVIVCLIVCMLPVLTRGRAGEDLELACVSCPTLLCATNPLFAMLAQMHYLQRHANHHTKSVE